MNEPVNVERLIEEARELEQTVEDRGYHPFLRAHLPLIKRLADALDAANERARVAETAMYVPGVFRCTKCNFTLVQRTLHAQTGGISVRDDPGEKCPNDGAPLWRVTHEQQAKEAHEQWEEQVHRAVEAEAKLALSAPLLDAGYAYQEAERNALPMYKRMAARGDLLRQAEALPPRDGGQADG